ncbi:MAG: acyl CoA:acetate/3-ketoacid CoA transferase [Bacillota bacterium]
MTKIITAEEAVKIIKDNHTIAVSGFCGFGAPEELLVEIEKRFLKTGSPKYLTVMNCAGCGDGKDRGMNHFGNEGMVRKVYCGHIGLAPKLGRLVAENKAEGYCVPQGVTVHILRAIAGKKPGVLTHVGLRTFADPRLEGCKTNAISHEEVVRLLNIDEKDYLFYKAFPIDVALIRGTTSDERGNITMEKEALFLEQLLMAQAAKNSGGIVIAQVERIAKYGTLRPKEVKVPGVFVDYVVTASPENHCQSFAYDTYNESWSGELKIPLEGLGTIPLNERKICARRASMELRPNDIVNLGIGVSEGVSNIASEEGFSNELTLTIEAGTIGGIPAGGLGIGASYNPDAIIEQCFQFDFYDGGGIDVAFLGMAQVDKEGNVNVSKFNGRVVGPGGFINITQNAKRVVFCGTFTAGGLKVSTGDGRLKIVNEGRQIKFKELVDQITFSGRYAFETGQKIMYITERAVFENGRDGLVLTEIAPGVDLQKDILNNMEFKPIVSENLKLMKENIFRNEPMGIAIS